MSFNRTSSTETFKQQRHHQASFRGDPGVKRCKRSANDRGFPGKGLLFRYTRTHDTNEIVTDAIYPVCAPSFLDQNGPFTAAENLLDASLIHTDWGPASASFPIWRNWFEAASVSPGRRTDHGLVANSSMAAINLAISGLGVTLCQGLLAARFIDAGLLVHAYNLALPQGQPYCLTIPQRSVNRPIVSMFENWLLQICSSTARSPHLEKIRLADLPE
jgi:LysR family glycine cleavage system transcriptional activator